MGKSKLALIAVLTVGVLLNSFTAEAQSSDKPARVGILASGFPTTFRPAFVQELSEYGWVEGRSIIFDARFAEGKLDQLTVLAAELAKLNLQVIVALGTPSALAAKHATATVPIVVINVADPVASGLVASLARPGGNITGISVMGPELARKSLEVLREAAPKISRIAVLLDPANPAQVAQLNGELGSAARTLSVNLMRLDVRTVTDLESVLAALPSQRAEALVVYPLPIATSDARRVMDVAVRHRLPTVTFFRSYIQAGGLMAYFVSEKEIARRTAVYLDKILRGAKPADLPVEQPTKIALTINMKTAKALGLTIPPSLLLRADHVIE